MKPEITEEGLESIVATTLKELSIGFADISIEFAKIQSYHAAARLPELEKIERKLRTLGNDAQAFGFRVGRDWGPDLKAHAIFNCSDAGLIDGDAFGIRSRTPDWAGAVKAVKEITEISIEETKKIEAA